MGKGWSCEPQEPKAIFIFFTGGASGVGGGTSCHEKKAKDGTKEADVDFNMIHDFVFIN